MRRTTTTSIIKAGKQGKEQPVYSTKQNTPQCTVHFLTRALSLTHSHTHAHKTIAAMTMTTMMMMMMTTMTMTKITTTMMTKHRKLVM